MKIMHRMGWWMFAALLASLLVAQGGNIHQAFPARYSAAQAQQGKEIALVQCASCHGGNLEGRFCPPLSGPRFLGKWGGRSAKELNDYILARMPLGRAGTLSKEEALEVVAYILQVAGFPSGQQKLTLQSLGQLELPKP